VKAAEAPRLPIPRNKQPGEALALRSPKQLAISVSPCRLLEGTPEEVIDSRATTGTESDRKLGSVSHRTGWLKVGAQGSQADFREVARRDAPLAAIHNPPPIDQKSTAILEELTTKRHGDFNRECAENEGYELFEEPPEDFRYVYWGERIVLLYELVINRPPRNMLERWLNWKSSEGNALFVALMALLISISVGIITLGLAGV
jgi:hypothetical protein